jgi:hypothetical protein
LYTSFGEFQDSRDAFLRPYYLCSVICVLSFYPVHSVDVLDAGSLSVYWRVVMTFYVAEIFLMFKFYVDTHITVSPSNTNYNYCQQQIALKYLRIVLFCLFISFFCPHRVVVSQIYFVVKLPWTFHCFNSNPSCLT